jgi:hypothetical protein
MLELAYGLLRNPLVTFFCPILLMMSKGLDPGLVATKYGVFTVHLVIFNTWTCFIAIRSHGFGKP